AHPDTGRRRLGEVADVVMGDGGGEALLSSTPAFPWLFTFQPKTVLFTIFHCSALFERLPSTACSTSCRNRPPEATPPTVAWRRSKPRAPGWPPRSPACRLVWSSWRPKRSDSTAG